MRARLAALIQQNLPIAIVVSGIGLTAIWVTVLGYGLVVSLIELVI
jgi:hypothetical protein